MTASKGRAAILSRAALAPDETVTLWPLRESMVATLSRIISLSSTISILLIPYSVFGLVPF
jgi:hypothetical protein